MKPVIPVIEVEAAKQSDRAERSCTFAPPLHPPPARVAELPCALQLARPKLQGVLTETHSSAPSNCSILLTSSHGSEMACLASTLVRPQSRADICILRPDLDSLRKCLKTEKVVQAVVQARMPPDLAVFRRLYHSSGRIPTFWASRSCSQLVGRESNRAAIHACFKAGEALCEAEKRLQL